MCKSETWHVNWLVAFDALFQARGCRATSENLDDLATPPPFDTLAVAVERYILWNL
jgi:hypothetical protein